MDLHFLIQKIPTIRNWIDQTIAQHRESAHSLASLDFPRIPRYTSCELLQQVAIVPVPQIPIPPLSSMGLTGFVEFEQLEAAGITYGNTVFILSSHLRDEALFFHELVHVEQWNLLGPDRFILAYALGHIVGGGYRSNPLEEMAYSLQSRFETKEKIFNVSDITTQLMNSTTHQILRPIGGSWPI